MRETIHPKNLIDDSQTNKKIQEPKEKKNRKKEQN